MSEQRCKSCKVETEKLEKGLCPVCRETESLHETIANKLRTRIQDPLTEKAILKDIDELAELSKESQWRKCKQVIIDTMTSEKLNHKTAWRLFVNVQNIKGQSQHLEDWEKEVILLLRNTMKFSLNTIAFILGRSKETIYRHAEVAEK